MGGRRCEIEDQSDALAPIRRDSFTGVTDRRYRADVGRGRVVAVVVMLTVTVVVAPASTRASAPSSRPSPRASDIDRIVAHDDLVDRIVVVPTTASRLSEAVERVDDATTTGAGQMQTHGGGFRTIALDDPLPYAEARVLADSLVAAGLVAGAEPDVRLTIAQTPNDPLFGMQWHLNSTYEGQPAYGIGVEAAWEVTTGSPSVVVAVIDTGILPHPDLAGRVLPGYDMISSSIVANDGNGRDPDPSDPGDSCGSSPSSWHGTHVAGTIGASTNNGIGIAGIDQQARILPVRALGTCGGSSVDTADAIRWAAGLEVDGVPRNQHPARVINISLGGLWPCFPVLQSAISAVTSIGVTVVAAAGNDAVDAGLQTPANCPGVLVVAATTRTGDRAAYSNVGSIVDIAAPGGQRVTRFEERVLSTLNTGTVAPQLDAAGWGYAWYQGTSMAAPHASGVVSLMLAVNSALSPSRIGDILRSTATAFPPTSQCSTTVSCGTGILDAGAAVRAAVPPPPSTFNAVVPGRVFDTRSGEGGVPVGAVVPGVVLRVPVVGRGGVPVSGVSAVSLNVTVTRARADGFVSVVPCVDGAGGVPVTSSLNFVAGQTVPNAVIVPVGAAGDVCFYASGGATDLIADLNGWFA
jgi:serine protease